MCSVCTLVIPWIHQMFLGWIQMQPSPLNFQTGLKVSNHLILLSWAVLFFFRFTTSLFCSALSFFSFLIFSASTVVSEQPPPRPPKPAVLLKSKNHFSSSLQSLHYKSKFPKVLPDGFFPEPFYDSVLDDDDDLIVTGVKKLSLKTPTYLGLRFRPWESTSPSDRLSEVSLIDFGDDSFSSTSPSPITETPNPSTAKPPVSYAASILDMAPPQSPNRALPNPMHPTPVVDWDMQPLPPLPAYDEVAVECAEQEDMEVSSINASVSQEDVVSEQTQSEDGVKIDGKRNVEDNLFLPAKHAEENHSFSQSADIFRSYKGRWWWSFGSLQPDVPSLLHRSRLLQLSRHTARSSYPPPMRTSLKSLQESPSCPCGPLSGQEYMAADCQFPLETMKTGADVRLRYPQEITLYLNPTLGHQAPWRRKAAPLSKGPASVVLDLWVPACRRHRILLRHPAPPPCLLRPRPPLKVLSTALLKWPKLQPRVLASFLSCTVVWRPAALITTCYLRNRHTWTSMTGS